MNIAETARAIYAAVKDSPVAAAAIRDEFALLALAIATDPNSTATVTSSTVNGQTFSTTETMTNGQRLMVLRHVVLYLDRGRAISSTSISVFNS